MAKKKPHAFVHRICHWFYCDRCGLVQLKNKQTGKAISKPCPGSDEDA